jgi:NAD(P)-dependent dehydrogenase (short-subunit alcohol dehydrogenase family)
MTLIASLTSRPERWCLVKKAMKGTCLVLGPGGSLGEAIVRRFAAEGMQLVLIGRNPERLAGQVTAVSRGVAAWHQCDLADTNALSALLDDIREETGTPDAVIYNAATVEAGTVLDTPPSSFASALAVGVLSAQATAQRLGSAMRDRGTGSILFTGGGVALKADSAYSQLSVSKAAMRALATCIAEELTPAVRVAVFEICGAIRPNTTLDPDLIAGLYWDVHSGKRPGGEVILR